MALRILLVDVHRIMRDGIKTILGQSSEFEVIGEAESGAEAVQICKKKRPDNRRATVANAGCILRPAALASSVSRRWGLLSLHRPTVTNADSSVPRILAFTERSLGMALARCETCGCPRGMKQAYPHAHRPLSYPNASIMCGAPTCIRPACVWLTDEEERAYLYGERNFRLGTHTTQVQVA
jgi:CheY-like chemotaxis protein